MRICLIQSRNDADPALAHEQRCFQHCIQEIEGTTLEWHNFVYQPITLPELVDYDVLMFGGSGDYSISRTDFDWRDAFINLLGEIVDAKFPTFASCFGFQALVAALGGSIEKDPDRGEVGTFPIRLTDDGLDDGLFGRLPSTFNAQLGHNDSAVTLPSQLVHLAASDRCEFQAVRVLGAPIVATQFHPELTAEDNISRFLRYLSVYRPDLTYQEAESEALEMHDPSPEASTLIPEFLHELRDL